QSRQDGAWQRGRDRRQRRDRRSRRRHSGPISPRTSDVGSHRREPDGAELRKREGSGIAPVALAESHLLAGKPALVRQTDDERDGSGTGGPRSEGPVRLLSGQLERAARGRLFEDAAESRAAGVYARLQRLEEVTCHLRLKVSGIPPC